MKRERALLDRLTYDGFVRLHFTFQDALSLYMGLEVVPNGGWGAGGGGWWAGGAEGQWAAPHWVWRPSSALCSQHGGAARYLRLLPCKDL